MTDRIWIKGRSAWHATTVADIDTARNEDRMVAVTCDDLIDARDTATISTERPETGCCGGCMVRIDRKVIEVDGFSIPNVHLLPARPSVAIQQRVGRHLRWHKFDGPIDVIRSRNPLLLP